MYKFRLVAIGGTFDIIHKGHRELLRSAFELGDKVLIGLTTDTFIRSMSKPHRVKPYVERLESLKKLLVDMQVVSRAIITPIEDPYGPTISDPAIEAIVVSDETCNRAFEINRIREIKGLKALKVVKIPMVLAEDGKPISSTRIRLGEIDENGRLLR
ncbi:phosphopantetheine adenylyltransferase [Candidatus Bathyarchaeota archaeon]|nr:phosphopantetheine adenylyltransferase [Candidatus Bathyarchaeota archaeon]MBS7613204.1 phosphopantetheine adenylyltransferase [Candidatus Bathyarchaeota archaeon]MBS7617407.1 phosphopantetheine adenylyltransferase [Candidatus Bathyarchaeota archaeon]